MRDGGPPRNDGDPDQPMRQRLINLLEAQPFTPFVFRLEGGFEVRAASPEFVFVEVGVTLVVVFSSDEAHEVFGLERVVSLKTLV